MTLINSPVDNTTARGLLLVRPLCVFVSAVVPVFVSVSAAVPVFVSVSAVVSVVPTSSPVQWVSGYDWHIPREFRATTAPVTDTSSPSRSVDAS